MQGLNEPLLPSEHHIGLGHGRRIDPGEKPLLVLVPEGMQERSVVVDAPVRSVDDGEAVGNRGRDRQGTGKGTAFSP
jgi:hypothetical protein